MSYYIGTKTACEAYNKKVSDTLGFNGSITIRWADVRRHPSKSLFAIIARSTIAPDEGASLRLTETLTEDWNETDFSPL